MLRAFNRSFTQRIGVLDERFLGLDRPLGASRLLWEIGRQARPLADLRESLALDSAYLSRLLRQLESEGLCETVSDPADRRRRLVRLTAVGRTEWEELERRSEDLARSLVAPLAESQQRKLAEALRTVERLLEAAAINIEPTDPLDPAAVQALHSYFAELNRRFDTGFDPGDTITVDAPNYRPPAGLFLLARTGRAVGACGAVHVLERGVAEIKRMWVHPDWRGLGLGRRLLESLEHQAAGLGCATVRLDTNDTLIEAIGMYTSSGYHPIDRYNDNPFAGCWFQKQL